jgi:hypothetical protein
LLNKRIWNYQLNSFSILVNNGNELAKPVANLKYNGDIKPLYP